MLSPKQTRVVAAIAVFLLSDACAAQATRQLDARRSYIEARARYSHEMDSIYKVSPVEGARANSAAVRELAIRLRSIVGPFSMRGMSDSGTIDLGTFISGNEDTDLPDGIVYHGPDKMRIFVTDSAILHAWITQRYHSGIPTDLARDLPREEVNTFMFWEDAAVVRYADLPVSSMRKRVYAAQLIDRAQDYCPNCTPGWVLVTVGVGSRVMIADAPLSDSIPVPSACKQAAMEYWKVHQDGDEGFARLLRCYAISAKADPRFRLLVDKAQSLIDALPDE